MRDEETGRWSEEKRKEEGRGGKEKELRAVFWSSRSSLFAWRDELGGLGYNSVMTGGNPAL